MVSNQILNLESERRDLLEEARPNSDGAEGQSPVARDERLEVEMHGRSSDEGSEFSAISD